MHTNTELTVESANDYGYHILCFKKVTALNKR